MPASPCLGRLFRLFRLRLLRRVPIRDQRVHGFLLAALVGCASLVASPLLASEEMQIRGEGSELTVEPVDPGTTILLIGVARFFNGAVWSTRVTQELLTDSDTDGEVRWDYGDSIPLESVWFAVDRVSGQSAMAVGGGAKPAATPFAAASVQRDPRGQRALVTHPGSYLHLWVIRREGPDRSNEDSGAWAGRFADGSRGDSDGARNRVVTAHLDDLEGLGDSLAPPEQLGPEDTLVMVDPDTLRFTLRDLGAAPARDSGARTLGLTSRALEPVGELPNFERGFKADRLYQFDDLEQVNLFNGNLSLTIPIGQEYPVGDGFSYGFSLVYNSRLWDWAQDEATGNELEAPWNVARATTRSNAGLGWRVSLGELLSPADPRNRSNDWIYVGPDGADHVFGNRHNKTYENNPLVSGIRYTSDGSYLRLRQEDPGKAVLDLPNGERHTFKRYLTDPDRYRLTRMEDRLGNWVVITYSLGKWTVTDRHGRVHHVKFVWRDFDDQDRWTVKEIDLSAFGGARARYTFRFRERDVYRACGHTHGVITDAPRVPLLEQVLLPEGGSYQFTSSDATNRQACAGKTAIDDGALREVKLPTKGRFRYTYRQWELPVLCGPSQAPVVGNRGPQETPGIATREHRTVQGALLGRWGYASKAEGKTADTCVSSGAESTMYQYQTTTVTTPLGDQEKSYFSLWQSQNASTLGFRQTEYALAVSHHEKDPKDASRSLSRQILDCDESAANCQLRRSIYADWEQDRLSCAAAGSCGNRRVRSELTLYHDDRPNQGPATYTYRDQACFDGFGHYRKVTQSGTLPGGAPKVTQTQYNPEHGVLVVGADGSPQAQGGCELPTFSMLPTGDPWILGTYAFQTVSENGETARTDFAFDPKTGFLEEKRAYQGTGKGKDDVRVTYARQRNGPSVIRVTERLYGGDTAGADAKSPAYTRVHRSEFGTLRQTLHPGYPPTLDLTIDSATGLPSQSRDVSGFSTSYSYDMRGRITEIRPKKGAWVSYRYQRALGASRARVYSEYYPASKSAPPEELCDASASPTLACERVVFDDLGRVASEARLMPGGTNSSVKWRVRYFTYDKAGNRKTASEWGASQFKTRFEGYDPFGRPGKIVPPEGEGSRVVFQYTGVRKVKEITPIGSRWDAEENLIELEDAERLLHYDRHGRLYQVVEPSGPEGGDVTTTYGYDYADRLTRVATQAGQLRQVRTFAFDRRGFATRETHPERDGALQYSDYDALGNVGERIDGNWTLRYEHDGAGRLEEIWEGQPGGRLLKKWEYYDANQTGSRGRLRSATRYNYAPPRGEPIWTVGVTETYRYREEGQVESRSTDVCVQDHTRGSACQDGEIPTLFEQSFAYNELGAPSGVTYPTCEGGNCAIANVPARTVSYDYEYGYPVSIPGYVDELRYHPNRTLATIDYANGVSQSYIKDPRHRQRPYQITTTGVANDKNWNSGLYGYDGAGNVIRIGGSRFRYDPVSRLAQARVRTGVGPWGPKREQSYTYDAFGNLQGIAGDDAWNTATDTATNRLSLLGGTQYDSSGNATQWPGKTWEYDPFNLVFRYTVGEGSGAQPYAYFYTADDERIWAYDQNQTSTWALRGLDGKVLREYTASYGVWTAEDNIYGADGRLLATETRLGDPDPGKPPQRRYLHSDHLGTVRQVTDEGGAQRAFHVYYPFGMEVTAWNQDTLQMKFTGHERDLNGKQGPGDDMDYMHARYHSPLYGRFLSVDPINSGKPGIPQSWNKYSYARNNPVKFTDPDGKEVAIQAHEVAFGISHLSIRIEPENQARYAGRADFGNTNTATGGAYATLGAGPDRGLLGTYFGLSNLESDLNRGTDIDLSTKTEVVVLDLGGRDEDDVIRALIEADANYSDDLDYGGTENYNSNSYVSGLLETIGLVVPVLQSNVPGYDRPVPQEEFEPE